MESIDFTIDDTVYTAVKSGDTWTINDTEVEFGDVQDAIDGLTVNTFNDETADRKQEIAFTVHLDSEAFPEVSVAVYSMTAKTAWCSWTASRWGWRRARWRWT